MADLRAAAQALLDAIDAALPYAPHRGEFDRVADSADDLRAALSKPSRRIADFQNVRDYISEPDSDPQQAEPTRSQKLADAGFSRRPSLWALQARHALELIAAPQRADGTWNRDREACRQLAAEALGRYDDE